MKRIEDMKKVFFKNKTKDDPIQKEMILLSALCAGNEGISADNINADGHFLNVLLRSYPLTMYKVGGERRIYHHQYLERATYIDPETGHLI